MAAANDPRPHSSRRHRSLAEKRHLVELTLRPGGFVRAIALEHGVHQNTLCMWRKQYRAGKLGAKGFEPHVAAMQSAPFVPVSVAATAHRNEAGIRNDVLEVVFASGATLRIEAGMLDRALVSALVAELRR